MIKLTTLFFNGGIDPLTVSRRIVSLVADVHIYVCLHVQQAFICMLKNQSV